MNATQCWNIFKAIRIPTDLSLPMLPSTLTTTSFPSVPCNRHVWPWLALGEKTLCARSHLILDFQWVCTEEEVKYLPRWTGLEWKLEEGCMEKAVQFQAQARKLYYSCSQWSHQTEWRGVNLCLCTSPSTSEAPFFPPPFFNLSLFMCLSRNSSKPQLWVPMNNELPLPLFGPTSLSDSSEPSFSLE